MKARIKKIIICLALLIISIMIIGTTYYTRNYPQQDFDQILFYLFNGIENTSPEIIKSAIAKCFFPGIIFFTVILIIFKEKTKKKLIANINIKNKSITLRLYPIKHIYVLLSLMFIIASIYTVSGFKINEYIKNRIQISEIYDNYYIDGRKAKITFPEEKRNLIIIIVESMENTVLSKENGGNWRYSITPELENFAIRYTNFSNTDKIGGAYTAYGTTFSAGGIVAITSGVPLIVGNIFENINQYEGNGRYLAGVYALGDVLKKQGYNLEVMMGSDGTFGGRTQYFNTHGEYKIFDVNYAIEQGKMSENEKVWWGFEDDKLYEWSKEEIQELAKQDKPFNYIMLTADTHCTDGYLSKNVENKFDKQYENVYAYSSKSIYEFVKWIQEQDFYNNTTIAIVGDHLGMQNEFYEGRLDEEYTRTIYNVIINSERKATNNKNRDFTSMDIYPTILASIGVEIKGERLGLGTNLYSGKKTLVEELGYEYFEKEIKKNSTFYNLYILGEDYYNKKREIKNESEDENEENICNNTNVQ